MRKKLLSASLSIIIVVLLLVGCGSSDSSGGTMASGSWTPGQTSIKLLAMIPISVEDTGTDRIPEIRTFGGGADWEMVVDAMTDINLALHVGECIAHLSDKKFMVEIF